MEKKMIRVKLEMIDEPKEFIRSSIDADKIRELAGSIKETGLLQPATITRKGDRYEIAWGRRRFLALKMLGVKEESFILDEMDRNDLYCARMIENLQREDLSPIEEGRAYKVMKDKYKMSINQVAYKLGKSRVTVTRKLRMLDLPEDLIMAVHENRISEGAADVLMNITDTEQMRFYFDSAIRSGITIDVAKQWVNSWKEMKGTRIITDDDGRAVEIHSDGMPIYMSCKTCHRPVDINDIVSLSICPNCANTLLHGPPATEEPEQPMS